MAYFGDVRLIDYKGNLPTSYRSLVKDFLLSKKIEKSSLESLGDFLKTQHESYLQNYERKEEKPFYFCIERYSEIKGQATFSLNCFYPYFSDAERDFDEYYFHIYWNSEKQLKELKQTETFRTLTTRRSCRKFIPNKFPSEIDIDTIITAGTYAPSGMGRQPVKIIAVTNKELRNKISEINASIMKTDIDPFYGAPVILIVIADRTSPTYIYDGSLVMGNLMNTARSLGLSSIWIHRAKEEFETEFGKQILTKLGIEGEWEGIGHVALGYADGEQPPAAERKENVYWIK